MQEPKNILVRAGSIYIAVILLALWICTSIIILQFDTSLKEKGNIIVAQSIDARRGDILACDGRILVTSLLSYSLHVDVVAADDSVFKYEVKALSEKLANLFGDKKASDYEKQLRDARRNNKRYMRMGDRLISFSELQEVKQFPVLKAGFRKKTTDRNYEGFGGGCIPIEKNDRKTFYDKMAFRTLGWQNEDGKYVGLEGFYDHDLKGILGKRYVQRIGNNYLPVNNATEVPPRDGADLVSTIDIDIQDAAETALRRQLSNSRSEEMVFEAGCVIVMEVETGAVRAIANMKRSTGGVYKEDYNYAVGRATEPGSTFKLFTLMALLEDGKVSLDDMIATGSGHWTYGGHTFREAGSGGYGTISVQKAFEKSSNVAFAMLAVDKYKGNERQYVDKLYALKLNEKMNLPILGEATQQLRYPGDKLWSTLSLPMMAMGYEVSLSPLKTLMVYNAVANGGRMMKPLFATELRSSGRIVNTFPPEVVSSAICSQSTVKKLKQVLEGVVTSGTAKNICDSTRYSIAGKTGTSRLSFNNGGYEQNGERMYQASFAGYFPAEKPKYSMIVVLYTEPTKLSVYGGAWAAPVFKEIADKIYAGSSEWIEEVKPINTLMTATLIEQNAAQPAPKKIADNLVPSVMGFGLKDALYLLENQGLKVRHSGAGKVISQSLEMGMKVVKGMEIHLELR